MYKYFQIAIILCVLYLNWFSLKKFVFLIKNNYAFFCLEIQTYKLIKKSFLVLINKLFGIFFARIIVTPCNPEDVEMFTHKMVCTLAILTFVHCKSDPLYRFDQMKCVYYGRISIMSQLLLIYITQEGGQDFSI